MKRIVSVLATSVVALTAMASMAAQGDVIVPSQFSCANLQQYVRNSGWVGLKVGGYVIGQFVMDGNRCGGQERPVPQTVTAQDGQCTLYTCERPRGEHN